jgi:ribosomal protein S8E
MRTLLLACSLLLALQAGVFAKDETFGKFPKFPEMSGNTTPVSEIMKNPDAYVGKTVLIKGSIIDVCPMRGCWMKVSSDQKQQSILIKVNDGEMVFPMHARGKKATLEGTLIKRVVSKEDQLAHEKERAKAANKPFDPSVVKGPKVTYMFKPTGVVISDK